MRFDAEIFSPLAKSSEVVRRELTSYRLSYRMEHPESVHVAFLSL